MAQKKTAAEVVQAARSADKISTKTLINGLFNDFVELHGDRNGGDDPAIIGGIARLGNRAVTVIATQKGETVEEKIATHYGDPEPEGYRKALRLMRQAAKFNRPIITLINTAGAYPGADAEAHGQGEAIAALLQASYDLPVPFIATIFGEGGSGGALALACADEVWMFENSIYSVLSPEGFASILWKDSTRADEAAGLMKLTPNDLLDMKIIDTIIPEPANQDRLLKNLKKKLLLKLADLSQLSGEELIQKRLARFREF
ncbi:acetyl-coenzyme A carboxylase carboxyl transferase subunit alpha [Agrilactobacillus composti DSM 18527 = JCM 14202]|uniref:acetyl-CoA carboxytransferase n=1 Tax=Agrilactobacillus composti DSM 18527 = JCM 14202 TaxID=1423734 RepID=A0A0R1XYR2_9LACO|nr:carboxyltransferase subunit alpha [Agrilactobacillus composti]KRM33115.1 acetyl-coenzyme A carboxylase carboxyl transferase subunit alpha [Agrilactobacillus composti DSM 18527 = JCM 14202]